MKKSLVAAAAAAIAFAPFSMIASPPAQAGPLCAQAAQVGGALYQRCLEMERNQNLCGSASGCTPGDPCTVGSAGERQVCADVRAGAQQP
jgi:hypothetical protein